MKHKLFVKFINFLIAFIRSMMALRACVDLNKLSWALYKSAYGVTLGFQHATWDYLNGVITDEEYDRKFKMYMLEI
jgi:hypothetical protein